jgi:hypothetical protein
VSGGPLPCAIQARGSPSKSRVGVAHGLEFGGKDACQDQVAFGADEGSDASVLADEQIGLEVGTEDIVRREFEGWLVQVGPGEADLFEDAVLLGVVACDGEGDGIDFESGYGVVLEFSGGDGEQAGAGAEVEEGLRLSGVLASEDGFQAEPGGGVMAGAEAESGVEFDDDLAGPWQAWVPGRFKQELAADDDGGKVTLPAFGPVLGWKWACGQAAGRGVEVAVAEVPHGGADAGEQGFGRRFCAGQEDAHAHPVVPGVVVGGGGLACEIAEEGTDGLFGFG